VPVPGSLKEGLLAFGAGQEKVRDREARDQATKLLLNSRSDVLDSHLFMGCGQDTDDGATDGPELSATVRPARPRTRLRAGLVSVRTCETLKKVGEEVVESPPLRSIRSLSGRQRKALQMCMWCNTDRSVDGTGRRTGVCWRFGC